MKLFNIKNSEEFFSVIDSCKGTVELVSPEGDRLNLKSKLCQFVTLTKLFAAVDEIPELELVASDPDDRILIMNYMTEKRA